MMKHTIFARLSHDYRTMKIAPIHCIARVPSYRTLTPSPDFRTILARKILITIPTQHIFHIAFFSVVKKYFTTASDRKKKSRYRATNTVSGNINEEHIKVTK